MQSIQFINEFTSSNQTKFPRPISDDFKHLMNCYKKLTTHHKEGVAKDDTNNVHSLIGLIKGVNTQVGQSDHVTKTNWQGLITLDTIVG